MLEAVLFDFGDTLAQFVWDDELLDAGHSAGLKAIGHGELENRAAMTERFRAEYLPLLVGPGVLEEREYPALVRDLLGEFGINASEAEIGVFLEAEHETWKQAHVLLPQAPQLLDALRWDGLRVGLVSNAFDPPELLHADLERLGLANRLDVAVFSCEVGWRKPHPAVFERALSALEVSPEHALFVGDRRYEDVRGARELGMTTAQAVWFREDTSPLGLDPHFILHAPGDLTAVVAELRAP